MGEIYTVMMEILIERFLKIQDLTEIQAQDLITSQTLLYIIQAGSNPWTAATSESKL